MLILRRSYYLDSCAKIYHHAFSLSTCIHPQKLASVMFLGMCGNGSKTTLMDLKISKVIIYTRIFQHRPSMEGIT